MTLEQIYRAVLNAGGSVYIVRGIRLRTSTGSCYLYNVAYNDVRNDICSSTFLSTWWEDGILINDGDGTHDYHFITDEAVLARKVHKLKKVLLK